MSERKVVEWSIVWPSSRRRWGCRKRGCTHTL